MIDTIFIDLGDTLRVIRKNEAYSRAARQTIVDLLGADRDADGFYESVIEPRYSAYREWALKYCCEAPVKVLWARWLAYDFPRDRVEEAAPALTWAYRRSKGERVVTDGGIDTVKELYRRGYKLAIVSDLVGTQEVDDWLDRDGLRPYFTAVLQSSVTLIRKPHPAIYYYALENCRSRAEETCYVGDNLNRDIVGAKAAGLGMTVGVRYPDKKPQTVTDENRPDCFVSHFSQLLDLFPPLEEKEQGTEGGKR